MRTKICFKCKKEKSVNEFNKRKKNKDGLDGQCKLCSANYQKEYQLKKKGEKQKRKSSMKCCSKCSKEQPLSEFYKKPTAVSGLDYLCKTCRKEYQKEYNVKRKLNKDNIVKYRSLSKLKQAGLVEEFTQQDLADMVFHFNEFLNGIKKYRKINNGDSYNISLEDSGEESAESGFWIQ